MFVRLREEVLSDAKADRDNGTWRSAPILGIGDQECAGDFGINDNPSVRWTHLEIDERPERCGFVEPAEPVLAEESQRAAQRPVDLQGWGCDHHAPPRATASTLFV